MRGSRASSACASSRPSSRRPDARVTSRAPARRDSDVRPRRDVRVVSAEEEGRLAFEGRRGARGHRRERRRRLRCRRRLDGGGRRHAAARAGLGPVGRPRIAPPHRRAAPGRSAHCRRDRVARARSSRAGSRSSTRRGRRWRSPPAAAPAPSPGSSAANTAPTTSSEWSTLLASRPAAESAKALGLRADRAHTLLAGAMILAEVSRLLGVPFAPSRGGIREGAALRLAARRVAA